MIKKNSDDFFDDSLEKQIKGKEIYIGKMTLKYLINECLKSKLNPIAGCWYYSHFSKKTLEGAGMISDTRYLRIFF